MILFGSVGIERKSLLSARGIGTTGISRMVRKKQSQYNGFFPVLQKVVIAESDFSRSLL